MRTRRSILLVDDDPLVTETLAHVIRQKMCVEVSVVPTAEAALELLERETFTVVLADFRLPGMNGLELLGRCQQQHPHIRRALVTSHTREAMALPGAANAGIHALLPKPYSLKRVAKTLGALLAAPEPPMAPWPPRWTPADLTAGR